MPKAVRGALLAAPLGADGAAANGAVASAATPLHTQLYRRVRTAILDGALAPGHRLPSARTFAADLGVSRNTVEQALGQLRAEGFLVRRVGAGTYVTDRLPDAPSRGTRARPAPSPARGRTGFAALSARGRVLAADRPTTPGATQSAFVPCEPSVDDFPVRVWGRLVARHARAADLALLGSGEVAGGRALRQALAEYVGVARGVRCDWRQVVVVSSTQQALDLLARLLLDDGDAAWIEDPGYPGARSALEAAGASLVPVPVDADGIDVAAGERLAPAARLAYVTPSHQYPTGATMSLARRVALLRWARRAGAWIVEDDYDSEFRYTGRPLASLQGLDADAPGAAGRVVYVGTLNKVMFPALRVAYAVVPGDLVDAVAAARAATDGAVPALTQAALADFVGDGHLAAHLRHMRGVYRERRDALLDACARDVGERLRLGPAHTGLHVTAWLGERVDDAAASRRASQRGLDVPPLSRYYAAGVGPAGLVLHFAAAPPSVIRRGVRTLAAALGATR